jgi:hypothetical protein
VAGAAAAGVVSAVRPPDQELGGAVVLAGPGVDPSGTADSTAALQELVDAAPEGARLWLPEGSYAVRGLVLRRRQSLSGPSARSYSGSAAGGARLLGRRPSQRAPVLVVGEFGRVADISVEGNGRNHPAVRAGGFGVVLERVTMVGGSVGFDADYAGGALLTGCQVHDNAVGIRDLVDSVVQSSAVNANRGDGISLGEGANDNTILASKIEWNDGHGIQAYRAVHTVVLGGVLDRNGRTGAELVECAHTAVVGVVFRRNGRLAETHPDDDCHLHARDCSSLVVSGIVTDSGRDDDDASGYASPAVAVRQTGGRDVTLIGNDLTGRTSAVAVARDGDDPAGTHLLNLGVPGIETATGARVRVGLADLVVAPGATGSAAFSLGGVPEGVIGDLYRLHLLGRDATTGARGAAEGLLLVSRDSGAAEVALVALDNRLGELFGTAEGRYRVSATVDPPGDVLTLVVGNSGGGPAQIRVDVA